MSENQHIQTFDFLKGIGILLVVIGHLPIPNIVKTEIYAFHLPLFFFVSGCFFKQYAFKEFLSRKVRQLLIPYLFFTVVLFVFLFALKLNDTHSISTAFLTPACSLIGGLKGDENSYVLFRTIWFLPCLFNVSILYWAVSSMVRYFSLPEYLVSIIAIMLYGIGYSMEAVSINLPYYVDTTFSVLIYYHLGHLFYAKNFYAKISSSIFLPIIFLLLCVIFIAMFPYRVDLKLNIFPWFSPIMALLITLSMFAIIRSLPGTHLTFTASLAGKTILWCGFNSLAILGFHQPIVETLNIIFGKLLVVFGFSGQPFILYISSIIKLVIIILLCYFCTEMTKRWCPILLGKYRIR